MSAALTSLGTLAVLVGAVVGVLRSSWLLRHVPVDPHPTYSALDRRDGLTRLSHPSDTLTETTERKAS